MQHIMEALERRRMLSGVDSSFGPATGATFHGPGADPLLMASAVDGAGREMLAGETNAAQPGQMFLSRLNFYGDLDTNFGTGGTIQNTPRGLDHADIVVPLPDGGYLVGASEYQGVEDNVRLLRLSPRGAVVRTFGDNGIVNLRIESTKVLVQEDGSILVAGIVRAKDVNDVDSASIIRLKSDGTLDKSYGTDGIATLDQVTLDDEQFAYRFDLTSAALVSQGRVVLTFSGTTTTFDLDDNETGGTSDIYVERVLPNGDLDSDFGNGDNQFRSEFYQQSWSTPGTSADAPQRTGVAVTNPAGDEIIVLSGEPPEASFNGGPITALQLDVLTDTGAVIGAAHQDFASVLPGFVVQTLRQGSILAMSDQTFIISGTSGGAPALAHFSNDALDADFGNGGVMTLDNSNGLADASDVASNPDGSINVISTAISEIGRPADHVGVTRIFPEDRPVVSLLKAKQANGELYVTVSIRGTSAIDTGSLDENDLHIGDGTNSFRMHLKSFVAGSNNTVTATYRVNLALIPKGLLQVYAGHAQVADMQHHLSVGGLIGQVLV